ncbi:hypothetical protein GGF32_009373 [Allomyces javanicus]|nr:hypothetical protein GGF32_009373 [Allomyces javanicus]
MTQYQTSIVPADLWDDIRKRGQMDPSRSPLTSSVLSPNVTMVIQDGDKVAGAGRVPTDLINQLKLLQLVSDIGDCNCFLVLTKASGASTTTNRRGPPPSSRHFDPTGLLDQLKQAGVGFFEAGRSVACLDFDAERDDYLQLIRAKLCDLHPVKMRCTYSQLVAAARGDVASLNKMREAMRETVKAKKSDRIKNLRIAILSTVWISFAGQAAAYGMEIAREHSMSSVKTLNDDIKQLETEIKQLEMEINNNDALAAGLQHRLTEYQKLVAQVVDVKTP